MKKCICLQKGGYLLFLQAGTSLVRSVYNNYMLSIHRGQHYDPIADSSVQLEEVVHSIRRYIHGVQSVIHLFQPSDRFLEEIEPNELLNEIIIC